METVDVSCCLEWSLLMLDLLPIVFRRVICAAWKVCRVEYTSHALKNASLYCALIGVNQLSVTNIQHGQS